MPAASEATDSLLDQALGALEQGDLAAASSLTRRALEVDSDRADLWSLDGLIALRLADRPQAERSWRQALALGATADVCNRLGDLLAQDGRTDEAEACWRSAIANAAADAGTWQRLGLLLMQQQRDEDALSCYEQVLAQGLHSTALLTNVALLHQRLGRLDEALDGYRRALTLEPGDPDALVNLGVLLAQRGQAHEAETAYRAALSVRPDDATAHTNLGLLLEDLKRFDEALAHQRRAHELAPASPAVLCHLADILARLGGEAEAQRHYEAALRIEPACSAALTNLGAMHFDHGRHAEAEAALRQALAISPDAPAARLNLGQLMLGSGRLAEGWPLCEARYRVYATGALPRFPSEPGASRRWRGEPLAGASLLVWPEQGHGDQMQFCRYLAIVKARWQPARLTLVCTAPLAALLQGIAGADEVVTIERGAEALRGHDFWVPLLSLPGHCGTDLHSIPAATPYLHADPRRVAHWAPRLGPPAGQRVGLVWRGNPLHDNDADRSLPGLPTLAPLWTVAGAAPGLRFVSLQKTAAEDEARAPPAGQPLQHLGSDILGFDDTAAIVDALDLLITVDTAAAHLAGAMGKPCWVLLPARRCDWRWMRERSDTPWYPTLRLFRQAQRGDWATPVAALAEALRTWACGPDRR